MSDDEAASNADVAGLSYEQARDELVRLVSRIESGSADLEESMTLWERGEVLAAHCQAKLDQAQAQLDRSTRSGQAVSVAPQAGAGDAQAPAADADDHDDASDPDVDDDEDDDDTDDAEVDTAGDPSPER